MTVARYVTLCRVKLGGVDFAIDTPIALSPDVAQPLLATKSIAAQAGAIPAMPTVLGDPVRDVIDLATGNKVGGAVTYTSAGSDRGNAFLQEVTAGGAVIRPRAGRMSSARFYGNKQTAAERGASGTYDVLFRVAPVPFKAVQVAYLVTRAPTDPTYTSDDILNYIAVAPTSAPLVGGTDPISSEGAGAWSTAAEVSFARQPAAAVQTPIPVLSPPLACESVARSDGGPGRLVRARCYSAGSGRPDIATMRVPTYMDQISGAGQASLWDSYLPLAAQGYQFFKAGDYASVNQQNFTAALAAPARVDYGPFVGLKPMYTQQVMTCGVMGDSTHSGATAEAGVPTFCGAAYRAVYKLQLTGAPIDLMQLHYPGYRWDQYGEWSTRVYSSTFRPDFVLLPAYSHNGTGQASSAANTRYAAMLQWAQVQIYRERLLALGIDVILFGPWPDEQYPIAAAACRQWMLDSDFPCIDIWPYVANSDGSWMSGYALDSPAIHPAAVANDAVATALAAYLKTRYRL